MLTPRGLVQALGGEPLRDGAVVPGPGHDRRDRSLRVFIDPLDREGFKVHSFSPADDPLVCRDYVRDKLGLERPGPRRKPATVSVLRPVRAEHGPDPDTAARKRRAVVLWNESADPRYGPVEDYWNSRRLDLADDVARASIRFLAVCPWGGDRGQIIHLPAQVAAMRNIISDELTAIHRTAIDLVGQPILDADGRKLKRMLGVAKGAAVKLDADAEVTHSIVIGEGIETTQSARQLGYRPAWALGSAGGIETFPVLPGVETLSILAEFNRDGTPNVANAAAIDKCAARWHAAGREVLVVEPTVGGDLNDALVRGAP
jgi:putative DNA primase/helicase